MDSIESLKNPFLKASQNTQDFFEILRFLRSERERERERVDDEI